MPKSTNCRLITNFSFSCVRYIQTTRWMIPLITFVSGVAITSLRMPNNVTSKIIQGPLATTDLLVHKYTTRTSALPLAGSNRKQVFPTSRHLIWHINREAYTQTERHADKHTGQTLAKMGNVCDENDVFWVNYGPIFLNVTKIRYFESIMPPLISKNGARWGKTGMTYS